MVFGLVWPHGGCAAPSAAYSAEMVVAVYLAKYDCGSLGHH